MLHDTVFEHSPQFNEHSRYLKLAVDFLKVAVRFLKLAAGLLKVAVRYLKLAVDFLKVAVRYLKLCFNCTKFKWTVTF